MHTMNDLITLTSKPAAEIYREIRAGLFPAPRRAADGYSAQWDESEYDDWAADPENYRSIKWGLLPVRLDRA